MATNTCNFEEYSREYRKQHPEKVKKWRYSASCNYVLRYLKQNPELVAEFKSRIDTLNKGVV